MQDTLIAIELMRGVERIGLLVVSGLCLILACKLAIIGQEQRLYADSASSIRRFVDYLHRVVSWIAFLVVACILLYSVAKPQKAEVSDTTHGKSIIAHSPGATNVPLPNLCEDYEIRYEDAGI